MPMHHDETYYLRTPFQPQVMIQIHNPMADYDEEEVHNYLTFDMVSVNFSHENPNENSASLELIPKRMSFLKFDRRAEQMVLEDYEDVDHATVKHIYKQEGILNKHPAIYNVYVVEYDNTDDRTVIMQYLIDSKYYQANLIYYAHTQSEFDTIFSPRVAIEQTFSPAYEYFESFKLLYRIHEDEEDEEDDDDDEKSSHML
jgi:hypothetical protein